MIGRSVSHYKVLERVGGGGMGDVYRAEDTKLRRTVALKFLPRELGGDEVAKKRFMREAQAASALDHPNICNIYEIDETPEGQLFIAMAYYDGDSLKDLIARGPMDVREAFEIAMAIAQGLARAHRNGIVHRDIKPANVMITRDGFVKLVDFGLAKLEGASRVTHSQYTVGTVSYMSPEQAAGEKVDARTDIWSLGVVMHEMLTGSIPWQGGIDQAVIYSIMTQDPAPVHETIPAAPRKLSAIIQKCLAKDLKERYQTADELIEDLGVVARELGWGSSIAMRSVSPITRGRYRKWPRIAGIISAAAVVFIAGFIAWQRFGPRVEQSVYVTENRIAVLPLENMIGVAENAFSDGLSEVICYLAEEAGRGKKSTWVVPFDKVVAAPIAAPDDAIGAFGANQVIIGSLQRFADRRRVSLRLCNASDLHEIRSASLNYDGRTGAGLSDSLASRVATLLGVDATSAMADYLPHEPAAMAPYTMGLGLLQGDTQGVRLDSAIVRLEMASALDPEFTMGLASLGKAHLARYELSKNKHALNVAQGYLQQALSISPNDVYANIYSARVYFWMELHPESIERYKAALARAPGHPYASLRLAWVYNTDGRFDEAESLFLNSIGHYPDYWATHFELGVLYYYRDRLDDALARWNDALQYAPNDVTTLNNIGAFYHLRGEWQLARRYFERAFQINPTEETCSNMGLSHYFLGEYAEAARYYEFALGYADTTDYQPWGNLAAAQYWAEGQRPAAIETYRTAIRHALREFESNPEDPYLIALLIDYYTMSGDWQHGMEMIAYGDSVASDDADVLFAAGDAYERRGQRQIALRYLRNAVRHGYPKVEIERTPSLTELVKDPMFKRMIAEEQSGGESPSSDATSNP